MSQTISTPKRKISISKRNTKRGLLFALPWMIGFLCFQLYPILCAVYYSFSDFNVFGSPNMKIPTFDLSEYDQMINLVDKAGIVCQVELELHYNSVMDFVYGGIYTCLDRKGGIYSTDKSVWMQGRAAWVFAYLCSTYGVRPEWLDASKSCLDFMETHCINREKENRMYFTVTADGRPLRQRRYCFSEGFYTIANAEYAAITKDQACMRYTQALLFDLRHWDRNDFLAVNQFTVTEGKTEKRPDVVVFVNGIPLVVMELKSAANEEVDISGAYRQLQTYKHAIPNLFVYNAFLVISDGVNARAGTLTSDEERFMAWRTIDGEEVAPLSIPQLEVLIRGMFRREHLLEIVSQFELFQTDGKDTWKILAGYHQYHAVLKAVESTERATMDWTNSLSLSFSMKALLV